MSRIKLKSNLFDLTHDVYTTCDMGYNIPVMAQIVNPGDTIRNQSTALVRLMPMVAPQMTPINVRIDFYFVPMRLLWKDFENHITGGPDGLDTSVHPYITIPSGGFASHSLADYFGIKPGTGAGVKINALFFRAYNKIWNEWYRDENLQSEVAWSDASGADTTTNTTLLKRCWQKDRFTNALPFAQRGNSVSLPIGTKAPLKNGTISDTMVSPQWYDISGSIPTAFTQDHNLKAGTDKTVVDSGASSGSTTHVGTPLFADLQNATSATINDLRKAFQVQKWMERNATYGVRYIEYIMSHFGVRSSDARLQRSEYIGGGKAPVVVSEVIQTSSTDSTSPQGNMAGHGFSVPKTMKFTKGFEEFGIVMGIMSITPRTSYMDGLDKKWSMSTKFDYMVPEFQHLGMQPILEKEVYLQDASVVESDGSQSNDKTFGFEPIYQEYRHQYSYVTGDFRTNLKHYTLVREFGSEPSLNANFVECNPSKRIFADTSPSHHSFMVHVHHDEFALRLLDKYGNPGGV